MPKKLSGRKKQIADGISGLCIEKTNAYRESWGLPPMASLPETREIRGIVRFDQPGIVLNRNPYNPLDFSNKKTHRLIFARGCFDEADISERHCSLKRTDHSKRAIATTSDGSLSLWVTDEGLRFSSRVHWAISETLEKMKPRQVSPSVQQIESEEATDESGMMLLIFRRVLVSDIVVTDHAAMGDASEWSFVERPNDEN